MKRKKSLKKTPLRKVSSKLSKELKRYYVLRDTYLTDFPFCEIGVLCEKLHRSTQIHHGKGRGKYLNALGTWFASCNACHQWVHQHSNEARKLGWLLA